MSTDTQQDNKNKEQKDQDEHNIDPRIVMLTRLLDDFFKIPGTKFGIGLDGLLGLIPIGGDIVTGIFGYWMYKEAKRLGVPPGDRLKIVGHYALDTIIGFIPFAGDLLDFAYKANRMSLEIIEKHLEEVKRRENRMHVDAEVKDVDVDVEAATK